MIVKAKGELEKKDALVAGIFMASVRSSSYGCTREVAKR